MGPEEAPRWRLDYPRTGTALDEFLDLYAALAVPQRHRPGMTPAEVDALDVSEVAMLVRMKLVDGNDWTEVAHDMLRRRVEAAAKGEPEPTW